MSTRQYTVEAVLDVQIHCELAAMSSTNPHGCTPLLPSADATDHDDASKLSVRQAVVHVHPCRAGVSTYMYMYDKINSPSPLGAELVQRQEASVMAPLEKEANTPALPPSFVTCNATMVVADDIVISVAGAQPDALPRSSLSAHTCTLLSTATIMRMPSNVPETHSTNPA